MKALSIHPEFAMDIMYELKTIEIRTWSTNYRGDVLICSTAKKVKDTIPGHAIAVVTLSDVHPITKEEWIKECGDLEEFDKGYFAWILTNVRLIKAFPVKGKLSLWNFADESKIEYAPFDVEDLLSGKISDEMVNEYYPNESFV